MEQLTFWWQDKRYTVPVPAHWPADVLPIVAAFYAEAAPGDVFALVESYRGTELAATDATPAPADIPDRARPCRGLGASGAER